MVKYNKMRITYLVLAAMGFLVTIKLDSMNSQYTLIPFGFGWIMIIFGIFCKEEIYTHQMPGTNIRSGELGNSTKLLFGDSRVRSGGKECDEQPMYHEVLGTDEYSSSDSPVKTGGKEGDLTNPVLNCNDTVSRIDGLRDFTNVEILDEYSSGGGPNLNKHKYKK